MPGKRGVGGVPGGELEHASVRGATVLWVKQRSFPWWPAMVTYDPDTGQYSRPGKAAEGPPSKYHVQFFGEDPMRAWVGAKTGVRSWEGPKGGPVEQKIPKTYLASWPVALEQAETAFGLSYTQRLQMFATDFRETKAGAQPEAEAEAVLASYSSEDSEEEPEQIWIVPDDPKKPKKAASAYFCFTSSRRESLIAERPELAKDVTQIAKALGAEWSAMDEAARQPFVEQSAADKLRYAKQMESYVPLEKILVTNPSKTQKRKADKAARKKNKDKNAPKRAASPYFLFTKDARPKLAAENPGLKITEIAVKLGQMWKALTEAQQKPYYDLAAADKERYARQMETYVPPPQTAEATRKKPIGKREAARKEKEKKERKRKRQEEAEKAELKQEVGRIWQTILDIEIDGKNWLDAIQTCASWPCGSDHRKELGVSAIDEKLEQWSKPVPDPVEEKASQPPAEGADDASAEPGATPAVPPAEYTPAQFSKDVEAIVAAVQTKAQGTAADKMPPKLSLLCKELLVDLKARTSKKSGSRLSKNELQNESWCTLCEEGGVLICCEGGCTRSFHPSCLGLGCVPKGKFVCDFCKTGTEVCFLCGGAATAKADMLKCEHPGCGKYYHKRCKKELPRVRPEEHGVSTATGFVCPRHVCANSNLPGTEKWPLVPCIRCPIAYHDAFLPAGCTPKYDSRCTICPRHTDPGKHPSTPNCMVCEGGGSMVCCDTCPGSFHIDCIRGKQGFIEPPDGDKAWSCPECINGTKPCIDDIVWAKVGNYRWWPAKIRAMDERPEVLAKRTPDPGQFAVCYYGTNEWGFQSHACTVSWEFGDERRRFSLGAKKKNFSEAVEEAKLAYDERLKQREDERGELIETVTVKPMAFKKISSSKAHPSYVEDKAAIKREREELQECVCDPDSGNSCGPGCLNREMYIECDPKTCPCGKVCNNRRIQRRQIAKIQTYKTADKGFGLRTNEKLQPGDLVTEYCGEIISSSECADRLQKQGAQGIGAFYMVSIDAERIIDAGPMGNLARFANHSCGPNMVMQKWNVLGQTRVGLFACKDVEAGEELTWNYNLDAFEGHKKLKCFCGASNCSGYIGVKAASTSSACSAAAAKEVTNAPASKKRSGPVVLWKGMQHPTHFKSILPDLTTVSNERAGATARTTLRKLGRNPFSLEPQAALKKVVAATKRKAAAKDSGKKKKSKTGDADAEAVVLESDEEVVEEWVAPKDPNRPKRGMTAFFFFLKHGRDTLLADRPDLKVQEVSKVMGAKWAKMSTRAQSKYLTMAEKDKDRYLKEMETYVPPPKVKVMTKRKLSEKALAKREQQKQQQQKQEQLDAVASVADAQNAVAARPVAAPRNDGFSIWGKGRTELGPASDEEEDAELSAAAAAAAAADAAAARRPQKAKRVAKYLRQTSAATSGGAVGSAEESSDDELENESGISNNRAGASVAPVHNIWAVKAQQKQQDKNRRAKGKGKGKSNAKGKVTKVGAGSAGTKGVKRTGDGVSGKQKRPRPAGCRSSSRHATISPVFADTATTSSPDVEGPAPVLQEVTSSS